VQLSGEIDIAARDVLHDAIAAVLGDDRPLLLDLREVSFLDSTGIAAIAYAVREGAEVPAMAARRESVLTATRPNRCGHARKARSIVSASRRAATRAVEQPAVLANTRFAMSVVDLRAFISHSPDGTVAFCLDGDLDAGSGTLISEWVTAALDAGATMLVFDLRDVRAVERDGLETLAAAHERARQIGAGVRLRAPSKRTVDLLLMTGLDRVLPVDHTSSPS